MLLRLAWPFVGAVSSDVHSPGLPRDAAALESNEVNLGDVLKALKEGSVCKAPSGRGSGSGSGLNAPTAAEEGNQARKAPFLCKDGTEDAAYEQLAEVGTMELNKCTHIYAMYAIHMSLH
jgi:hypothetical protein